MKSILKLPCLLIILFILAAPSQASFLVKLVHPHIEYHKERYGGAEIRYLKVTDFRHNFHLKAIIPSDGIGYLEELQVMASENRAVAGINANFYHTGTNIPVGLLIKDWEVLSSNYGRRAALTYDYSVNRLIFSQPSLSLFLHTPHEKIKIDCINCPLSPNKIVLYTPKYCRNYVLNGEIFGRFIQVRIRNDQVIWKGESTSILVEKRDYYLVLASGQAVNRLDSLDWGEKAKIEYEISSNPYIKMAVSAGPMLVKDGQIVLDPEKEDFDPNDRIIRGITSRSAVAVTPDGSLILLVVLKNYRSPGMDLKNLSRYLSNLGVKDALAMDGGSSSSLVYKDDSTWHTVGQNNPIAVGLVLIPKREF